MKRCMVERIRGQTEEHIGEQTEELDAIIGHPVFKKIGSTLRIAISAVLIIFGVISTVSVIKGNEVELEPQIEQGIIHTKAVISKEYTSDPCVNIMITCSRNSNNNITFQPKKPEKLAFR